LVRCSWLVVGWMVSLTDDGLRDNRWGRPAWVIAAQLSVRKSGRLLNGAG
jgi:hypothetical protein